MKIAVIGGGINGIMTAWELQKTGCQVDLFEKDKLMENTSSSSSKLLHGGLRYLENYEFRLVKEALGERSWWINQAPELAKSLKIFLPIYKHSRRPAFLYKIGLLLYDFLAGKETLGSYQSYTKNEVKIVCPMLKSELLISGFSYYDGIMDDYQLGLWAAKQAKQAGVNIVEQSKIETITTEGVLFLKGSKKTFDRIINIAGPWAQDLLEKSNIQLKYKLDLIRGSHIVIDRKIEHGFF